MQEIIKKINEKLVPSGWHQVLRLFLESSDFSEIIEELKRKVDEDNQRFCPAIVNTFRFMETCPYDKIKAVMLVDHIFNKIDFADGVPLSMPDGRYDVTIAPFFATLDSAKRKFNVNRWVAQGVLMIPIALTSRVEGRAHKKIWGPFIIRIIEAVNKRYPEAPWLLLGDDAHKYFDDIVSPHIRQLPLKHPIEDRQWHTWINNILTEQKKGPITWTYYSPQELSLRPSLSSQSET